MTKLLVCLALLGFISISLAQTCNTNFLLTAFGFDKKPTAESATALKFCKTLKTGNSCCAASKVNDFQKDIDALAEKLSGYAAARDTSIATLRATTVPGLQAKLATLKTNNAAALTKLKTAGTTAPAQDEQEDNDQLTVAQATELAENLKVLYDGLNLDTLKTGLTTYQKARTTCATELLKLQAAAWCLACDVKAADYGVGANSVALSTTACTRLTSACYEYLTTSATQSTLLSVSTIENIIGAVSTALGKIATPAAGDNGYQDLADIIADNKDGPQDDDTILETAVRASEVPAQCAKGGCDWICKTLFSNGQINTEAFVLGGEVYDPTAVIADVTRRLQASGGAWNPAADEAGVSVDWEDDPADVNSDDDDDDTNTPAGASIIKGGFVCVAALLSVFLF